MSVYEKQLHQPVYQPQATQATPTSQAPQAGISVAKLALVGSVYLL